MKFRISISLAHAALALLGACLPSFSAPPSPRAAQRLPTTVVPTHYTLALTPDLKTATFSGIESIDVNIEQPTQAITFNAIEIKFQSVEIIPEWRHADRHGQPRPRKAAGHVHFSQDRSRRRCHSSRSTTRAF